LYVIVIGLSGVGESLARALLQRGHTVAVIDKAEDRCNKFAQDVDALVINAEAEDNDNLRNAGIEHADALVTATGDDSVNLMVSTMAKEFKIPHLIAIVRDPEHTELFKKLGAEVASPDEVVAEHIYQSLSRVLDFLFIGKDRKEVFTVKVAEKAQAANNKVKDVRLPSGFKTLAILHMEDMEISKPELVIHSGDEVLLYSTNRNNLRKAVEIFAGKQSGR